PPKINWIIFLVSFVLGSRGLLFTLFSWFGGCSVRGQCGIDVANIGFWIIIVFIYTYFILHHRWLLLWFMLNVFPEHHKFKVRTVLYETREVTNGYLMGLLIEFGVVAVANCLAFAILGIEYAVLLGIIAA